MTTTATKVRDMKPGQYVTVPSEYGHTLSGILVHFIERGPMAPENSTMVVLGSTDGEDTVNVRTGLNYEGYVHEDEDEDEDTTDGPAVRVITDGGELVRYTEHTDSETAWEDFTAAIPALQDGEIAQLIEDDLIAAEHNPEYHGTAALDVTDYA